MVRVAGIPPCIIWHVWTRNLKIHLCYLTLKQLGILFFQNMILFYNIFHVANAILVWNWSDIFSVLLLLMAWCFSTRAAVATVLIMLPCLSSRLWVNQYHSCYYHEEIRDARSPGISSHGIAILSLDYCGLNTTMLFKGHFMINIKLSKIFQLKMFLTHCGLMMSFDHKTWSTLVY